MADYTKATGSSGTMMIRDTGTYVEFWINSNNSTTFAYNMPWRYTINGSTSGWLEFRYNAGAGWQRLGRWNITTDQTVTFYLGGTGTSGLGGPTTFSRAIDRTSAPPAPGVWAIAQIFDTSVQGDTNTLPNGGLAIDQIQVRYDESSTAASPAYYDPGLDAYGTITGLARGTTYYFWVRTHNSKGWSPWSARTSAKTHNFPPAPTAPVISQITQRSVHSVYSGNGDGGSPILEWQTGYGTDPNTPQNLVSQYTGTISGLSPGAVHYFWGRGRNKYGWGAWSARTSATLLAGAWVDVGGVKKRAIPFVKDNGVWKVAEPHAKIAGLWKKTTS